MLWICLELDRLGEPFHIERRDIGNVLPRPLVFARPFLHGGRHRFALDLLIFGKQRGEPWVDVGAGIRLGRLTLQLGRRCLPDIAADDGARIGGRRVGLTLQYVVGRCDGKAFASARVGSSRLLHGVDQLVREQPLAARRSRLKLAGIEHDVAADRVGGRADRLGGSRRAIVGVDAHIAEIMLQPCAHRGLDPGRKWRAGMRKDVVDDRGGGFGFGLPGRGSLLPETQRGLVASPALQLHPVMRADGGAQLGLPTRP